MGKINLGRERGVQPTNSAQHGATSSRGYDLQSGGYERLGRGVMSVAEGIDFVGDTLTKIYNDQSESRNRQEFLEGQTKYFDIAQAKVKEIENEIANGKYDRVGGIELLKGDTIQADTDINNEFGKWAKENITQLDTRNSLMEHKKLETKKLFAQISGSFLAHDRKRRADMFDVQAKNAIEGGSYENLLAVADAYFVGKSQDLKAKAIAELTLKYAEAEAKRVAEIENDADRQAFIDKKMVLYAESLEGSATDKVVEQLSAGGKRYMFNLYSNLSKANKDLIGKKYKDSVNTRLASLLTAKNKERELRIEAFNKFVNECKYLSEEDRVRAKNALNKALMAEDTLNKKAEEEAIKQQNFDFKQRTINLATSSGELNDSELLSIGTVRNAIMTGFEATNAISLPQKQNAHLEFLIDAVDLYDADADITGEYGRALLYMIEASFVDKIDIDALPKDATAEQRKNYEQKVKEYELLIENPQAKERLMRELKERLGVFANANIKTSEVKEYLSGIILEAVGVDSVNDLTLNNTQSRYITELKQAFIRKAMTAGLNDSNELGRWFENSEYVKDFKNKVKFIYDNPKNQTYSVQNMYTPERISNRPNVFRETLNNESFRWFEKKYQELTAKRNEKTAKEIEEQENSNK